MKCSVIATLALLALITTCASAAPTTTAKPGSSLLSTDTKIVGGIAVSINDYPYQLSLRHSGSHVCGASIIHTSFALTAAHCVQVATTIMTLRAGTADRTLGGTIHNVGQKIQHSLYNAATYDYDIALLKVTTPFASSTTIRLIALPAANAIISAGTNSTTSGWGTMNAGASTIPTMLRAVSIPVVSDATCKTSYGTAAITARMVCAGFTAGGKDSCQGDSGGPLVAMVGGVKQLIGVVSWGYSCAKPNYPGVYTNVASLVTWIKQNSPV